MAIPRFQPQYKPFGLSDPAKRTISNPKFGDEVDFLEYAVETQGAYANTRVRLSPLGGNPLHYHLTYVETFTAVEGVLGVELDGKIHHLQNGDTVTVPIGHIHRFFNPSDTEQVVFDCKVTPATDAFERILHVGYGLARDGLTDGNGMPRSLYHLLLIFIWGDTNLPGVGMWIMSKLAVLVAWHARWSGEERRLLEKYYGSTLTEADKKDLKIE